VRHAPELAVAIGVAAVLLTYREKLHHFANSQLSESEMLDGLVLLITALVVLPLAPDRYIGPYAALNSDLPMYLNSPMATDVTRLY
jgi:uncharacterized membrane protein (DUF4010 family)